MPSTPSWKWLSSRRPLDEMGGSPAPASRPCLPAIEQLDDRVMLSVGGLPDVEEPAGPHVSPSILIGMLKGELNLVKSELIALKIAADQLKVADVNQLKINFSKIDDMLLKLGQDAAVGAVNASKEQKVLIAIDDIFSKFESFIPRPTDDGQALLLPAVQKVREAALGMIKGFGAGETRDAFPVTDKEQKAALAISNVFLKMDERILKLGQDPSAPVFAKGFEPNSKIAEDFVKIDFLVSQLDAGLQEQLKLPLSELKQDTLNFLGSLTKPVDVILTGGQEPFTGGITLAETDDVLA
jgi:hypothetical protein